MPACRTAWLIKISVMAAILIGCAAAAPQRPDTTASPLVVTEARIAPDGRTIAFVRGRLPQAPESAEPAGLWRVSFAGGDATRLTAEATIASHPRWSPDGRQVAFLSRRLATNSPARVLVVPVDGGDARAVTEPLADVRSFGWSPDGRQIAYLAASSGGARTRRVAIVTLASGIVERPASVEGDTSSFAWSPSGLALAALVLDTGRSTGRIVVLPVSGPAYEIAARSTSLAEVGWSPDGATIAWLEGDAGAGVRVVLAAAAGRPIRAVPLIGSGSPIRLSWTGDGKLSITFASGQDTSVDVLDLRSGARVTVLPPGIARTSAAASWSADGARFTVAGSAAEHAAEVFAGLLPASVASGSDTVGAPPPPIRRITFSNQ